MRRGAHKRSGLDVRFEDKRELVPLRAQRAHDLPRIHGEAALAAVERNAGDEQSHAGKSSKNRRAGQGEWFAARPRGARAARRGGRCEAAQRGGQRGALKPLIGSLLLVQLVKP